jgi:hypothetical protein
MPLTGSSPRTTVLDDAPVVVAVGGAAALRVDEAQVEVVVVDELPPMTIAFDVPLPLVVRPVVVPVTQAVLPVTVRVEPFGVVPVEVVAFDVVPAGDSPMRIVLGAVRRN